MSRKHPLIDVLLFPKQLTLKKKKFFLSILPSRKKSPNKIPIRLQISLLTFPHH